MKSNKRCVVAVDYMFPSFLWGEFDAESNRPKSPNPSTVSKRKRNSGGRAALKREADPNHLKPQEFKVGYLYKRDGSDYKTKRHFRLSSEGGLKIYKTEHDKATSPLQDVSLDFMRCELQSGITDLVSPPRYHFCLKSDDLSSKSWYLAAESDYERKKWMISISNHVDLYCKSPVAEASEDTKEYLGQNLINTDDSTDTDDEFDQASQSNSTNVSQIAVADPTDDDIYGEFDYDLHSHPEQEAMPDVSAIALCEPRRGSRDRKTNTTNNIFTDLGTRVAMIEMIPEENDDMYMAAADVGGSSFTLPTRPRTVAVGSDPTSDSLMYSRPLSTTEDDIYTDGFSLARTEGHTSSGRKPILPFSKLPSLSPADKSPYPLSVTSNPSPSVRPISVPQFNPAVPSGPPPPCIPPLESDCVFSDDDNIYTDGTAFGDPGCPGRGDENIYMEFDSALEVPTYINTAEHGLPLRPPVIPPRSPL